MSKQTKQNKEQQLKQLKEQELKETKINSLKTEVKIEKVAEVPEIKIEEVPEEQKIKTSNPRKEKTSEQKYQAKKNLFTKSQILDITKQYIDPEQLSLNHLIQFKIYDLICKSYLNNILNFEITSKKILDEKGSFIDVFSKSDNKLKTILYELYCDIRMFHENYLLVCKIDKLVEDKKVDEENKMDVNFKLISFKINKEDYKRTLISFIGFRIFNENQSYFSEQIVKIFNELNEMIISKKKQEKISKFTEITDKNL